MQIVIIKANPDIITDIVKFNAIIPSLTILPDMSVIGFNTVSKYMFNKCTPQTRYVLIHALKNKNELVDLVEQLTTAETLTVHIQRKKSFEIKPIIVFLTDLDFETLPGENVFVVNGINT